MASFSCKRGFHWLADVTSLGLAYQHQGGVTTRRFLRECPDVVRDFVQSYIAATHRTKTDRKEIFRILAKYLRLTDKELLEETYESSILDSRLARKQPELTIRFACNPRCKQSTRGRL